MLEAIVAVPLDGFEDKLFAVLEKYQEHSKRHLLGKNPPSHEEDWELVEFMAIPLQFVQKGLS